jgi:exodeoxyribonuclease VII small subunit
MAKKTFEEALARLEEITTELEDGDLSLEKSLKKFEEGIKLAEFCNSQLTEAKEKVEILLERDGRLETTPFEGVDGGDQTVSE